MRLHSMVLALVLSQASALLVRPMVTASSVRAVPARSSTPVMMGLLGAGRRSMSRYGGGRYRDYDYDRYSPRGRMGRDYYDCDYDDCYSPRDRMMPAYDYDRYSPINYRGGYDRYDRRSGPGYRMAGGYYDYDRYDRYSRYNRFSPVSSNDAEMTLSRSMMDSQVKDAAYRRYRRGDDYYGPYDYGYDDRYYDRGYEYDRYYDRSVY